MTKTIFFLQFFAVLVFFIFPPIFAPIFSGGEIALDFTTFSMWNLLSAFVALVLLFQVKFLKEPEERNYKDKIDENKTAEICTKKKIAKSFVLLFFKTLFFLLLIAAISETLSRATGANIKAEIIFPKSPTQFVLCSMLFVFSAFYEEVMYRAYLPLALNKFFRGGIVGEIITVVVFAASHSQNGIFAVANAFFAGCVLRFCAKKKSGLAAAFLAHLVYNAASLVALRFV